MKGGGGAGGGGGTGVVDGLRFEEAEDKEEELENFPLPCFASSSSS
jgi:hypothetical protein